MTRSRSSTGWLPAALSMLGTALLLGAPPARAGDDGVGGFLAGAFTLDAADLTRLDAGEVVSRTLPANDPREVATLGIVRMRVTPAFYVARLLDIVNFKRDEAVLQIGVFGTPAAPADVATLTLDAADIRSLRECRIGRCGVQLPADAIDRFQREVNWQAADAGTHANVLMREIVADYAARYQRAGGFASMRYADETEALDTRHEFASLVRLDLGGWDRFPALRSHLLDYPESAARDTRDLLYWSKERTGRRSVATVTHLAVARTSGSSLAEYAIASKQIYGSHYYDASLGLTVLVPGRASADPVTYVAYLNRSRVDVFSGVFGKLARKIVTMKARTTVADQLARLQRTLETQFAASEDR